MRKPTKIFLTYIIAIGLVTRALWPIILKKPIQKLVKLTTRTKIIWPFLFLDFLLLIYIIFYLIKYIKVKKGIKLKNDNRNAKNFLIIIILESIGLIFFIIITIMTQKVLLRT